MKITKMPKRLAEPIPQVQKLMEQVMKASDDELPNILDGIVEWCWPRGDLHFWAPALNRFDTILEETCRDYDLANLQINEFTPLRKRIIISVLHFSRLLIENSTSRKLYNSYEHLRNLLFARDIDVLEATLRLFLRFAQQHSGQHPRGELLPSQERLATMAVTWAPREHGMDSVDFVKELTQIPPSFSHVRFQFYRHSTVESTSKADPWTAMQDASNVEGTPNTTPLRPRPRDRMVSANTGVNAGMHAAPSTMHSTANSANETLASTEEGLTTIDLGDVQTLGKDAMDVLADAIETHHIPQEDQFELFQKLRFATSLATPEQRRQILTCRLLAIACYAHITSENTASTQLFLYEPDIVSRLAALVKPEHDLPQSIVAGALYALDALGRYRSKLNEVLSSLSASVNHGVLMQVLRAVIDDLATGQPSRCDQLIDAFYGLVSFVTSTSVGSGLVVGAGLVQLLVQLIDRAKPETYIVQRSMTRALGLLDSVIYAYLPAFNLFCQAQGLEIFVRRIEEEVERGIQANADEMQEIEEDKPPKNSLEALYGKIPFGRAHLLRAFLQSISHMMVSTGTAEGLRNLVDTSMLASIKSIMIYRKIFGPQNLALGINVMATFVHNEPTSLGIIQEKKLPEAFLSLIKDDIEPHFDVINAVPNAVGALCLNQAGLDMFGAEPIIPKLLSLLTSERHIKVLSDQDNVTVFGASIDELTRHQPTMKQSVIEGLVDVLKQIQKAGSEFEAPSVEEVSAYHLSKAEQSSLDQLHSTKAERVIAFGDILADDSEVKKNEAVKDVNIIGQYADVTARFLEIFFQSANHCKDFIKVDGLVHLLNFYDLPCISYNFGASTAADSIVHLIRYIAEISPTVVIQGLLGEVKKSIDETKDIWSHSQNTSNLIKLIAPLTDEDLRKYDSQFRQLVKMNARIQLLSDVAPTLTYAGSKTPAPFLQVINGTNSSGNGETNTSASTIADLSHFHRDWVWESILFRATAPARTPLPSDKDKLKQLDRTSATLSQASNLPVIMEVEGSEGENVPSKEEGLRTIENMQNRTLDKSDPIMKNAAALRYIVSAVKMSLSAFFSETDRLLSSRRSHDYTHKRLAMLTATQIGKSLREFLVWKECDQAVLSCAYSTSAMQQALKLLYDERPSNIGNAQTFVLIPFLREGGLDQLIASCKHLLTELQSHFEIDGKPRPNSDLNDAVQLGYICSGIRACLDLFLKLVSSKALLESPATQTMTSKEGVKRSSSDYFDPHETLINLRSTILPMVLEVWNKAWLEHAPFGISSTVLQILLRIIEAEGESKPPKRESSSQTHHPLGAASALAGSSASAGAIGLPAALAGLTGGLGNIRSRGSALVPDENRIRQLMDMGFPRRAARHALVRCANNLSAAAEYLLMHPEVVTSMMDDDAPDQPSTTQQQDTTSDSNAVPPTTAQEDHANTTEATAETEAGPSTSNIHAESEVQGNAVDQASTNDNIVDILSQALPVAPTDEVAPTQQNDIEMGTSLNAEAEGQVEESVQKDDASATDNADAEAEEIKCMSDKLNELRSEIKKTLVHRALQLAERHGGLVFDVKTAVHLVSNSFANSELLVSLFDEVEEKSKTTSNGEGEKSISVRLHLLALIFHDTTVTIKLSPEKAKRFMGSLVTLVKSYLGRMQENTSRPIWLASLLLVLTAVLRAEYEIESIKIEEKEAGADAGTIRVTPSNLFDDDLPQLLSFCLAQFDHFNSLTRDDWLAVYRFLVILTRRRSIAAQFGQREEMQKLMKPFAVLESDQIAGCRALSVIILRNVLESDAQILRSTMKQDVLVWLSHQRTKTVDTTALSRALSYAMLRDPNTFIDILVESVHLIDYSVAKGQGFIKAIETPKDRDNTQDAQPFKSPLDRDTDEQMDETQESPSKQSKNAAQANNNVEENEFGKGKATGAATAVEANSISDTMMQFLLAQLIRYSREVILKKPQSSSAPGKQQEQGDQMEVDSAGKKEEKIQNEGNEREKQVFYTSFLLQILTELLSSYLVCKTSFLHSTKRKALHTAVSNSNVFNSNTQTLKKDSTPLKTKTQGSILHFFLTELIPSGFLSSREHEDMRRVMTISNWSMSVIVALCADVGSTISKNNQGEVGQTRKSVLDALAKAMKESTSSSSSAIVTKTTEPVETRYGRLYSMADLTYRLLKAQPNANPSSLASARPWDDSMLHLAKTMLERNFVTTLTSALAEIDLNLPMVKPLLDRILKPLEYLTKVAIKMNRAERKGEKQRGTLIDSDDSVTFTSDDSIEDDDMDEDDEEDEEEEGHHHHEDGREETPDFYRNSSLGMHTGDLEGGYQGIDEDEEEDDDEDEDMDDDMHHPLGFDDEHTDDSDDSDDDIEERIVEVMEEDDEDADMTDSDSDDDDEDDEDEGDEDGWIDEDDEDEIIDLDDSDDEGDEGSEALNFVIEGGANNAQELFEQAGHIFHGHNHDDLGPEGLPAPIMIEGEDDDEDEDEEEAMEDDEEGSVLEEVFEDGLQPLGLLDPMETFNAAPVDRFGANWGWTNVPDPASISTRGSGNGTGAADQSQDVAPTTVNPLSFIRQRATAPRHSRSRRLLDWDADSLNQPLPLGGRAYGFGPTVRRPLMGDGLGASDQDVVSHPLLHQDLQSDPSRSGNPASRLHRSLANRRDHAHRRGGEREQDWARSLEEMMEGGAMQFLETILSRSGAAGMLGASEEPIRISLTSQGGIPRMSIGGQTITRTFDANFGNSQNRRLIDQDGDNSDRLASNRPIDIVALIQEFSPAQTSNRWTDASRIVHGPQAHERSSSLRPYMINALRSGYLRDQEDLKRRESELEEEKRKNKADLEEAKQAKERVERELNEARAQFEELRRGNQNENEQQRESAATTNTENPSITANDVEMSDSTAQQNVEISNSEPTLPTPANLELGSLQQGLDELDTSASAQADRTIVGERTTTENEQADTEPQNSTATEQNEAQAEPVQRITTTVNGSEIDITDTGIDPTFLEALPEEMREEVLNQHFRERRVAAAAAAVTGDGNASSNDPSANVDSTSIAPEFLDALPPEIRAEVIQQEAQERARRRLEESRRESRRNGGTDSNNAGSSGPSEFDPISFLATLGPDLRNAVLMDQDQSFLDSLPANMLPEGDEARRTQRRHVDMRRLHRRFDATGMPIGASDQSGPSGQTNGSGGRENNERGTENQNADSTTNKANQPGSRDAIQLLDKGGIAALVRLMFFPQMDAQQSGLRHVMINLSENAKTRHELLNLLLLMLADSCSTETNAVDRSYVHMSGRMNNNKQAVQTPTRPNARRVNSTLGTTMHSSSTGIATNTSLQNPSSIAPISRTGDEAPFLIASRSIEMLLHLAGANERAAYYFLRDDPNNHSLMKWFKRNTAVHHTQTPKGKEKGQAIQSSNAPINILLILLGKPSILANSQLVDNLIALLHTVTRPLPTIASNVKKAQEAAEAKQASDKPLTGETNTAAVNTNNEASNGDSTDQAKQTVQHEESNHSTSLPDTMPQIAADRMAAVVKPLSTSISSKGFQNTLAVASNLATIDGARDLITNALQEEAKMASKNLLAELDLLLDSLPPAPVHDKNEDDQHDESRRMSQSNHNEQGPIVQQTQQRQIVPTVHINSPALTQLASPSSSQTIILRSLRALEWVISHPKNVNNSTSSNTAHPSGSNRLHPHPIGGATIGGATIRLV